MVFCGLFGCWGFFFDRLNSYSDKKYWGFCIVGCLWAASRKKNVGAQGMAEKNGYAATIKSAMVRNVWLF